MYEKIPKFINNHLIAIIASVFVLRVIFLFVCHLDLIGDEAYYWDWSRRPDWCYYSKPPMVAWLIAIFTGIGGDYAPVVRLPTVVLGTVFLGYFYATARAFYSSQAAAFAVLLMLAMPFNVLANLTMTIDPPLYCFWMMSLYYLHHALFENQQRAWFLAGVSTGAALLSKQATLFIPLMLLCFLLINQNRRALLKREFLIYLLPVVVCLIPILLWNAQHDWIMFSHSKGHFGIKESVTFFKRIEQGATFLLFQLLLATPVIFVVIAIMSVKTSLRFIHLPEKEQFLVLMGPILLLGIMALSFVQKVQGNWAVPFYFSALILLSGQWSNGNWKKSLKIGVFIGYVMVLLTYALPLVIQAFHLQNTVVDPIHRFRHSQDLAKSIDEQRHKILGEKNAFVLTVGHRFLTSQLAFYLPDHPTVFRYEESGQVVSQYEVWQNSDDYIGKNAFIVSDRDEAAIPDVLKSAFVTFYKVGEVPNPMNQTTHYYLFIGESLKSWSPINSKTH